MEYPFWVLIDEFSDDDFHIYNVLVSNESQKHIDEQRGMDIPCVILDTTAMLGNSIEFHDVKFALTLTEKFIRVYEPEV